jgi:broad specificity phosphatase PhoE
MLHHSKKQPSPSTFYLVRHGQSETNAISAVGKVSGIHKGKK